MPMQAKTVRHARQLSHVLRPVFPGYLFVRCRPEGAAWRSINATRGVARLVGVAGAQPSPVPEALMRGLQARCDASDVMGAEDGIGVNDAVRMVAGPFADYVGRVETLLPVDSVRLLFEFMGQATRVDLPLADVERL